MLLDIPTIIIKTYGYSSKEQSQYPLMLEFSSPQRKCWRPHYYIFFVSDSVFVCCVYVFEIRNFNSKISSLLCKQEFLNSSQAFLFQVLVG